MSFPLLANGRPLRPLERLPPELLLVVLRYIDLVDLPAMTVAFYPLLRFHNIAAGISNAEYLAIRELAVFNRVDPRIHTPSPPLHILSLPRELVWRIGDWVFNVDDRVNFALVLWPSYSPSWMPNQGTSAS